jgi:hypothetical protein
MLGLKERADDASKRASQLRSLREKDAHFQRVELHDRSAQRSLETAELVLEFLEVARDRPWGTKPPDNRLGLESLRKECADLRERFDRDPAGTAREDRVADFLERFDEAVGRLRSHAREDWRRFVDSMPNWTRDVTLGVNAENPLVEGEVAHLETVQMLLSNMVRVEFPTASDLEEIERRIEEGRSRWDALSKHLVEDPEILAFLAALGGGGASLTLATERVREWIRAQGLEDEFVMIRRTI